MQAQKVAERLAAALDAEDYEAVGRLLSVECVYHSPEGPLIGPAAIIASYRGHGASGRDRFEKIEYASQVDGKSRTEAMITFFDRVKRNGRWHEFRCRQHVSINADGHVTGIRHEEIPGERERLRAFEEGVG
jgi:hypothetical protein